MAARVAGDSIPRKFPAVGVRFVIRAFARSAGSGY
jgi:hypothetical protein